MAAHKTNRLCSIAGCGRQHAAHDLCLMHYKRMKKHGSPEYRWGGKVVGRHCIHCERPVVAREMCMRHYQMWHRYRDPLYADKKKQGGLPHGTAIRRGKYRTVCPVSEFTKASPQTDAAITKTHRSHSKLTKAQGFRDGSKRNRREWEHRKIAGAKRGQIVHHIDLDPSNNALSNLHVFNSPADHGKAHRSLERVAASLVHCGVVLFDRDTGCYRFAESSPPTRT